MKMFGSLASLKHQLYINTLMHKKKKSWRIIQALGSACLNKLANSVKEQQEYKYQ